MNIDRRVSNTLYSIALFGILSIIIFLIPWDSDFAGVGLVFATEFVAVLLGILSIAIRLFGFTINKTNFLYNYIGIINLLLAVIIIAFIILNPKDFSVNLFLLPSGHLLLSGFILKDIYKK